MPRNNILRRQAREMVFNVSKFMKKEAEEGLQLNIKAVQKRTAAATAVSERTVRRICVEAMNNSFKSDRPVFRKPGKKRFTKKKITGIDSVTRGLMKRSIHSFPYTQKELPTVQQVLKKLKEDIKFKGSDTSLRRILSDMGYCWEKTADDRKVLIEKMSIRIKRTIYFDGIMRYRSEGRPVIYTGVSHINRTDSTNSKELKINMSKGSKVVMLNAGSETGFVPNALLMFKFKSDNNNEIMPYETYEEWICSQLIPNLRPHSVIVVDNAPYNNKEVDMAPSHYAKRAEMEEWLTENCIPYSSTMLKPQLYELIRLNKCRLKKYKIDQILKKHNHTVLRLPPHHTDLNPIEMVCTAIKSYVVEKTLVKNLNTDAVKKLIQEKTNMIGVKDWKQFCDQTRPIEEEYIQRDHIIDTLTESIVIEINDEEHLSESDKDMDDDDEEEDLSSSDNEEPDSDQEMSNIKFIKKEYDINVDIDTDLLTETVDNL